MGQLDKAQSVSEQALKLLESFRSADGGNSSRENVNFRRDIECLKSDIHFIQGKIHHVKRNFPGAQHSYQNAIKLNDRNFAAQFNLGKVFFYNENYLSAESCLETVTNNPRFKDSFEAMRILAQIKGRLGKTSDSVELFKKVLELNPKDFEANIEIGQVYEQTDPKTASIYYEKALKII